MISPFGRILVGWDASAGAAQGLRLALGLAAAGDVHVTALAVVAGFAHVEDVQERQRAAEEVRAPLREAFDDVLASTQTAPGQQAVLEYVEAADVARALDRYAETHPIGLVVVGLHGREGLLHPKMGHVASHAVRISRCPVLVVPDPGYVASPENSDEGISSRIASLFHPFRHHEPVG